MSLPYIFPTCLKAFAISRKKNCRIYVLLVVLPLSLLISLEYQQHGAEYRPTAMRLKAMVICKETIWSCASSDLLTPQSTMESYKIVVNQRLSHSSRCLFKYLQMPQANRTSVSSLLTLFVRRRNFSSVSHISPFWLHVRESTTSQLS